MQDLKAQLAARQSIFTKLKTQGKAATIASHCVRHVLAKHKKPFKDSDIVKEAFLEAADSRFDYRTLKIKQIVKAIKEVQLSLNITTRRCEGKAVDVGMWRSNWGRILTRVSAFPSVFSSGQESADKAFPCSLGGE